jgi:hypothetical protein
MSFNKDVYIKIYIASVTLITMHAFPRTGEETGSEPDPICNEMMQEPRGRIGGKGKVFRDLRSRKRPGRGPEKGRPGVKSSFDSFLHLLLFRDGRRGGRAKEKCKCKLATNYHRWLS